MNKKLLTLALPLLLLAGCGSQANFNKQTSNLSADLSACATDGNTVKQTDDFITAQYDFTLSMLQSAVKLHESENLALSSFTAAQCIAAAGSGANADTRTEIENAFGGMDISALNEQLIGWNAHQHKEQLKSAVSVWLRGDSDFHLAQDFAGGCAEFFSAPFDNSTLVDINTWVSDQTGGAIPQIIEQFEPNEVFALIGALDFDAMWADPYADNEVMNGWFESAGGEKQKVQYMKKHMEYATYLHDNHAEGLMRDYEGARYAFGALMPYEDSLADYIAAMTPDSLRKTISGGRETEMDTMIPQFVIEQTLDAAPIMQDMGIKTAFDMEKADFSGMIDEQMWLCRAAQKSRIQVDRHGTQSSFAIDLEGEVSAAAEYSVTLSRPFVWFIYDTQYGLPVMIGTVQNMEE